MHDQAIPPAVASSPAPRDVLAVPSSQHICLLYRDDDERFVDVQRFFAAGVRDGHKLLYITDTRTPDELRRHLRALGVDLALAAGAEVKTTSEAYLPHGRFEPPAMIASLEAFCADAVAAGFPGCRCTGEMGWAARRPPGAELLIQYERDLNAVIERIPLSGICQYDVRLFDGATILGVLEAHPFLLVRGQVLRNPNFVRSGLASAGPAHRDERAHA